VTEAHSATQELPGIVEQAAEKVETYYVFPERAPELAAVLRAEAATAATAVEELAQWLTSRLRELTDDYHFRFEHRTFNELERQADPQHRWKQNAPDPSLNFGFQSVEAAGAIGTVKITPFLVPIEWSAATALAAFEFIRTARAVVIDLRECYGGDPDLIALISSYFLGPGVTELSSARWRDTGEVERLTARGETVPFLFDDEVRLVLVVGPRTASGGEALAYDLQACGRAVVVGSATLGAAHRIKQFQVGPLVATIPAGLVTNPITKSDWESNGVLPDVVVASDKDALSHALALAKGKLPTGEA